MSEPIPFSGTARIEGGIWFPRASTPTIIWATTAATRRQYVAQKIGTVMHNRQAARWSSRNTTRRDSRSPIRSCIFTGRPVTAFKVEMGHRQRPRRLLAGRDLPVHVPAPITPWTAPLSLFRMITPRYFLRRYCNDHDRKQHRHLEIQMGAQWHGRNGYRLGRQRLCQHWDKTTTSQGAGPQRRDIPVSCQTAIARKGQRR